MKPVRTAAALVVGLVISAAPALAVAADQGQGQALITVVAKNDAPVNLQPESVQLKIDGKQSALSSLTAAKGLSSPLELVLLIDASARTSLGTQLNDIESFVREMPANTRMAIAYMENGRAAFTGPLSTDATQVLSGLHLPSGVPGESSSPYFCLSDLAKNWPSHDMNARREVVMITDGVDYYQRRFDPNDPYVLASIEDSVRAGLVVYSFYWTNQGRVDRSAYESNAGQSLLAEVTQATGGNSYWEGFGNPVSFDPYFKDLRQRFQNQYRVGFSSDLKGKPQVERFSVKINGSQAKITAPQQVFVNRAGAAAGE
jgi:hypothetical protein